MNIEGWQSTFRELLPAGFLAALSADQRTDSLSARFSEASYRMLVAESRDGEIIGFADWGPNRHGEMPDAQELYAIYVKPQQQGCGIGRALFRGVARAVLEGGNSTLQLSVLSLNPNLAFYSKLGGMELGRDKREIAGRDREIIYFGWNENALRRLAPA